MHIFVPIPTETSSSPQMVRSIDSRFRFCIAALFPFPDPHKKLFSFFSFPSFHDQSTLRSLWSHGRRRIIKKLHFGLVIQTISLRCGIGNPELDDGFKIFPDSEVTFDERTSRPRKERKPSLREMALPRNQGLRRFPVCWRLIFPQWRLGPACCYSSRFDVHDCHARVDSLQTFPKELAKLLLRAVPNATGMPVFMPNLSGMIS